MVKKCRRLQLILPTLAFVATVAQTTAAEEALFLVVHGGHSGAAEIVDANYAAGERITRTAVEFAKSASYWPSGRLELRNNLCVVRIMSGDKANARKTCDRAVAQAQSLRPTYRQTRYGLRAIRAIALANRGVLRFLDNDVEGAKADFDAALRLRPALQNAIQNLNAIQRRAHDKRRVAQVNVMAVTAD